MTQRFAYRCKSRLVFAGAILILVAPCSLFLFAEEDQSAESPQSAVERNAESLGAMKSYYLHFTQESPRPGSNDGPLVREVETSIWCSGERRRRFARKFWSVKDGVATENSIGEAMDDSCDELESRTLRGWDPDHPLTLPLELGRSSGEFQSVRCGIAVRDPAQKVNAAEAWCFLWEPYAGWSLKELAEVARLKRVEVDSPEIFRLQVESTNNPKLADAVGRVIDLDTKHGWMIRRVEQKKPHIVIEVMDFANPNPNVWVAREVRGTFEGKLVNRIAADEIQVNSPIEPSLLQTQFPEGARVDESSGLIHVWGKGKPEKTFDSFEKFMDYVKTRAREYQANPANSGAGASNDPQTPAARRTFLIINGLLILLLFGAIVVRRRLSRGSR